MPIIAGTFVNTSNHIKLYEITLFLPGSLAYCDVYDSARSLEGKVQMRATGSILIAETWHFRTMFATPWWLWIFIKKMYNFSKFW